MNRRRPVPRAFIAYAGNLFPEHAMGDFLLMARYYTDVVLPFTQENAVYDVGSFSDLCAIAHAYGLRTWISPWGGRLFGGEGLDGGVSTESWLRAALDCQSTGVHFDEPKVSMAALSRMIATCRGRETMVSLEAERAAATFPLLPRLDVIATEAYAPDPIAGMDTATSLIGDTPVVCWVQAFRVPRVQSAIPGRLVGEALSRGLVPGVWTWMGGRGRGVLMSDEPEAVQISCDTALGMARA